MQALKLSEVSENGGLFRWSPGGPNWQRCGAIVRCTEDTSHTVSVPNWEATVYSTARCACAHNQDGSVTTMLCPAHAETDPCLTMASVTGKRRKGTITKGSCTNCGWKE